MRGGSGRGSRRMRSSSLATRSVFQARRWTCQVPSAKAVTGIMAAVVVVSWWADPKLEVFAEAEKRHRSWCRGGCAYLVSPGRACSYGLSGRAGAGCRGWRQSLADRRLACSPAVGSLRTGDGVAVAPGRGIVLLAVCGMFGGTVSLADGRRWSRNSSWLRSLRTRRMQMLDI